MTTDRFIAVAGSGQTFRRTRRRDGQDGCGLPVYELVSGLAALSPLSPGSLFPVHLRGGPHDGSHVWVALGDRDLVVAGDGARYRRTFQREARHGCRLPVFKARSPRWLALAGRADPAGGRDSLPP